MPICPICPECRYPLPHHKPGCTQRSLTTVIPNARQMADEAFAKATGNQSHIGIEDPNADHPVHHPNHYTFYKGLEVIDLTEQMNFNRGNAVKYIARAGIKKKDKEIEDLQKAAWYINREIERLENNGNEG